jgi:hypothetical protein
MPGIPELAAIVPVRLLTELELALVRVEAEDEPERETDPVRDKEAEEAEPVRVTAEDELPVPDKVFVLVNLLALSMTTPPGTLVAVLLA